MALKAFRYKTWQTHKSKLKEKGRGGQVPAIGVCDNLKTNEASKQAR